MKKTLLYCGILWGIFAGSCAEKKGKVELTLKKGTYEIWNDKPFAYRPCANDSALSEIREKSQMTLAKDSSIEIHSFATDGENTFVHNNDLMWIKTALPFSEEEAKYLRFLFPMERKGNDCKMLYGYFLNHQQQKIYVNNCIVDLEAKKCTKIDMSIYELCELKEGKYVLCKIKNSTKSDKWNESGEKVL